MTGDGSDVYEDSFMKLAKPSGGAFEPTLVLVGTRLGIDRVTPVYWEALKASVQMSQSMGIAGYISSSCHIRQRPTDILAAAALQHPTILSAAKAHTSSTSTRTPPVPRSHSIQTPATTQKRI